MDCFTQEHPQLGVREAARLVNMTSSTAGRLLGELRDSGVLIQNPKSRAYSLGGRVLAWAGEYSASLDVRSCALPHMQQLFESTGETISLYVLEETDRVCVERMESQKFVRIVPRLGRRLPLYAGAAGKVLLAFQPLERRTGILNSFDLVPFTPQTITEVDVLREDLERTRSQGYSVSHGEWSLEASGVSAPIFDRSGAVQGALTISGPSQRFTNGVVEIFVSQVTQSARLISQEMGWSRSRSVIQGEK